MTPKKNLYFFGHRNLREIGKSFPQLKSFETFFEAFLIMGYNYAWLLSASYVELSLTNAIFQLSVVRSPGIFCIEILHRTKVVATFFGKAIDSGNG